MMRAVSMRDPAGSLLEWNGRLVRWVRPEGQAALEQIRQSPRFEQWVHQGRITGFSELAPADRSLVMGELRQIGWTESQGVLVEHPRVWFPSYPQEWPAEMLHAAGELTLDLAQGLLDEGMGLKDATPLNVLFNGPEPTLVDLLSVEKRSPTESTWQAFGQFLRCFVYPLLAVRYQGASLGEIFTQARDGIDSEVLYERGSFPGLLMPPLLGLVTVPTVLRSWVGRKSLSDEAFYKPRHKANPELARFTLEWTYGYLRRKLRKAAPRERKSVWSGYMEEFYSYSPGEFGAKETIIRKWLPVVPGQRVIDIGCNTGHFSRLAAKGGSQVVAIDSDPMVVGRVWKQVRKEGLNVQPLVVNLARPTPGLGWGNEETRSFLERSHQTFDGALVLAVVHHLMLTEGIPPDRIVALLRSMVREWAIVEYIEPEDKAFRALCRGRDFSHLTREAFEGILGAHFETVQAEQIGQSQRWLYFLKPC